MGWLAPGNCPSRGQTGGVMTEPETALEVVASNTVAVLHRDGEAVRDFARKSLSPV